MQSAYSTSYSSGSSHIWTCYIDAAAVARGMK